MFKLGFGGLPLEKLPVERIGEMFMFTEFGARVVATRAKVSSVSLTKS
jgi:hypothetical protein